MEIYGFEDYYNWIKNKKKRNGDNYTEKTIEIYLMWLHKYEKYLDNPEELAKIVKIKRDNVIRSAFNSYLQFKGIQYKLPKIDTAKFTKTIRKLQRQVLSKEELKKLIDETPTLIDKTFMSALYDTAGRKMELLKLRWIDIKRVDPSDKELIRNNIYAIIELMGKGQKKREVYFGKTTMNLLYKLIKRRNETWDSKNHVFMWYNKDGKPLKYQNDACLYAIKKYGKKILNRKLYVHMFRHTKAQHMADDGADVQLISAYLGHSNLNTTMIYVKNSRYRNRYAYVNYSKDVSEL